MRRLFLLILFVSSIARVQAQDTPMNDSEILKFKKLAASSSQSTETIQSDFVQYKHLDFLDNDIITKGKLAFKAPSMVRWEYTEPYRYRVIFKDDKLLINDGGTKSKVDIGNSKMFKKLNELIINSVKGNLFNSTEFDITYFNSENVVKVIFMSKDKKMSSYIAAFELLFNKKDATVLEVKMVEPSEDFTRIVFSNRVLNSTISDAIFTN
jgi:outer membrane lipoprotein carrier protein